MTERELENMVLSSLEPKLPGLKISPRQPLRYAAGTKRHTLYDVDVLVSEHSAQDTETIPRVAIELKAGRLHTHDLIIYSDKAMAHRWIYGHLRYGLFVVGAKTGGISAKWLWHGHGFDFMLCCQGTQPRKDELSRLAEIVSYEVVLSREIQILANSSRGPRPQGIWKKTEIRP